jgi:hypothetical protein
MAGMAGEGALMLPPDNSPPRLPKMPGPPLVLVLLAAAASAHDCCWGGGL